MKEFEFMARLINMNITASYVIAAVLIIRLFIKRLPRKYSYFLWLFVALRLIFPFSVSSVFSMFNISFLKKTGMEYIPSDMQYAYVPKVNTGIAHLNSSVNSLLPPADTAASINPVQVIFGIAFYIWAAGVILIILREAVMYIRTAKRVKEAVVYCDGIYQCNNIPAPFVMGIFRPKIYIPFRMSKEELSYIVCHEKYHIKRHDNVIKTAAFVLFAIHWFNPLVWLAFGLMNRDMEESCDEAVLKVMGESIKSDYSRTLLAFASNRRF